MRWKTAPDLYWEWHQWFAWHPIFNDDGHTYWLEYVWRKRYDTHGGVCYAYAVNPDNSTLR